MAVIIISDIFDIVQGLRISITEINKQTFKLVKITFFLATPNVFKK